MRLALCTAKPKTFSDNCFVEDEGRNRWGRRHIFLDKSPNDLASILEPSRNDGKYRQAIRFTKRMKQDAIHDVPQVGVLARRGITLAMTDSE